MFAHTSPHELGPQHGGSITVALPEASNCSLALIAAAKDGARRIWREDFRYAKAGVVTVDLERLANTPRALFEALDRERSARLMSALDACNARYGRGAVVPAAAGLPDRRVWSTRFEMRSPRYTTRVDELPVARADNPGAALAAAAGGGQECGAASPAWRVAEFLIGHSALFVPQVDLYMRVEGVLRSDGRAEQA